MLERPQQWREREICHHCERERKVCSGKRERDASSEVSLPFFLHAACPSLYPNSFPIYLTRLSPRSIYYNEHHVRSAWSHATEHAEQGWVFLITWFFTMTMMCMFIHLFPLNSVALNSTCLQIQASLNPTTLNIVNDSASHAGHEAMRGNTSPETHFTYGLRVQSWYISPPPGKLTSPSPTPHRITVVSEAFQGKVSYWVLRMMRGGGGGGLGAST